MPPFLTDLSNWNSLWPTPVFASLVALIISLILTRNRSLFAPIFLSMLAMSLLGIATGQITGLSRTPAVGATIPAVLTLVGALSIYLISFQNRNTQVLAACSVICLSLNLLVGIFWGASMRVAYEEYLSDTDYLKQQIDTEFAIKLHREIYEQAMKLERDELGLPQPDISQKLLENQYKSINSD